MTTSRSDGRVQVSTAAPRPTDPLTAAVQFSRARFAEPGSAAWGILSRDDVFADTLAATSLAGYGPLLFTPTGALDPATAAELARTVPAGGTVYLLGGEAALSPAVEQAVRDLGLTPVRLAGASRLDTAVAVADEVARVRGTDLVDQVLLARAGAPADNPTAAWADSVAGGGHAAEMLVPVLLSDTAALSAPTAAWLAANGPAEVVLLVAEAALSAAVEDAVAQPTRRIGGDNRFETARFIEGLFEPRPDGALIADGASEDGWAYGLAAAGLVADLERNLLLTSPTALPVETDEALACDDDTGTRERWWITSPVDQAVRDALLTCPPPTPS